MSISEDLLSLASLLTNNYYYPGHNNINSKFTWRELREVNRASRNCQMSIVVPARSHARRARSNNPRSSLGSCIFTGDGEVAGGSSVTVLRPTGCMSSLLHVPTWSPRPSYSSCAGVATLANYYGLLRVLSIYDVMPACYISTLFEQVFLTC